MISTFLVLYFIGQVVLLVVLILILGAMAKLVEYQANYPMSKDGGEKEK